MLACTVFALDLIMRPPASLFTRTVIFGHDLRASVTLDRAAPVKLAVAAADDFDALRHHSEAAFIAQPAAALPLPLRHVLVALQTLPPRCALEFQAAVLDAVIRGVLQVDELSPGNVPECVGDGSTVVRTVTGPGRLLVHLQLLCVLVLDLQVVAHLSEVCQLHPAGLDAAAARHSVALAGSPHRSFDRLPKQWECYLDILF